MAHLQKAKKKKYFFTESCYLIIFSGDALLEYGIANKQKALQNTPNIGFSQNGSPAKVFKYLGFLNIIAWWRKSIVSELQATMSISEAVEFVKAQLVIIRIPIDGLTISIQ